MAMTVKAPREWEQMDPNEQYASAVEAAKKQLDIENDRWQRDKAIELGRAAEKEADKRYDRMELLLKRVGYGLLIALVVTVIGFFIWLSMVNNTDIARDNRVRAEWITKCSVGGGSVYQSAASGNGSGPLLCVVGGKVVQIP